MCTLWPWFQNLAPSKSTWTPPSLNYFRLSKSQLDAEESYGLRPNLMRFDQVGQVAVAQWATRPIKSYLPSLKTLLSTITSSSSRLRSPRMPPHNSPLPFFEFNHLYLIIWWHFFEFNHLKKASFSLFWWLVSSLSSIVSSSSCLHNPLLPFLDSNQFFLGKFKGNKMSYSLETLVLKQAHFLFLFISGLSRTSKYQQWLNPRQCNKCKGDSFENMFIVCRCGPLVPLDQKELWIRH